MKYLMICMFLISSCASLSKSEYAKVDRMYCSSMKKVYPEKYLKNLDNFEKELTHCAVTYSNFNIRKSLIRYKQEMFSHLPKWDGEKIIGFEYNIPYCIIATDKSEIAVAQKCEEIE